MKHQGKEDPKQGTRRDYWWCTHWTYPRSTHGTRCPLKARRPDISSAASLSLSASSLCYLLLVPPSRTSQEYGPQLCVVQDLHNSFGPSCVVQPQRQSSICCLNVNSTQQHLKHAHLKKPSYSPRNLLLHRFYALHSATLRSRSTALRAPGARYDAD